MSIFDQQVRSELASALGLTAGSHSVHGWIDGQEVIATAARTAGSPTVVSWVVPPLDLGLDIHTIRFSALRAFASETIGIPIADAAFEAAFHTTGDERHRVRALLGEELRSALVALSARDLAIALNDGGVAIRHIGAYWDSRETAVEWMTIALRSAARCARLINERRSVVPAASTLADDDRAWRGFARDRGLTLEHAPLRMSGMLDGLHMTACIAREKRLEYRLEAGAQIRPSLGRGLSVARASGLLGITRRLLPHQLTGDRAFDRRFVASGAAEAIDRFLDGEVREELIELSQLVSRLALDDERLTIECSHFRAGLDSPTPDEVLRILEHTVGIARRLSDRAGGGGALSGPYR